MIDLHIHTTHSSDGQHSPAEIVALAAERGITALSFCDHMDIASAAEGLGLARPAGIEFFTGVEISTAWEGREHHLLCYGYDPQDPVVGELVRTCCARIWERMDAVLAHFTDMGFILTPDGIEGWGRSIPTGVTMLRALVKANPDDPRLHPYTHGDRSDSPYLNFYRDYSLEGYGRAVFSAFPDLREAIAVLAGSGVPILAHPGEVREDELKALMDCGLEGIEVYSSYHGLETVGYLEGLARSLGLLSSAGSDFHGEMIKPGLGLGDVQGQPDGACMERLREAMASWMR